MSLPRLQIEWLKQPTFALWVLEAGNRQRRRWQGRSPRRVRGSLGAPPPPPARAVFILPRVCASASTFPFFLRSSAILNEVPAPLRCDPVLNNYIYDNPVFKQGHVLRLRGTQFTHNGSLPAPKSMILSLEGRSVLGALLGLCFDISFRFCSAPQLGGTAA